VETWRCPHCGTTQADGPRCWACSRHPVACGSCRNFRRAVAGRFGYCGLDRSRATLQGDELRACWQPPFRDEAFEGLFRELAPSPDQVLVEQPAVAPSDREAADQSRTWAVPVYGSTATPGASYGHAEAAGVRAGSSGQGLVDAPYVPARGLRSVAERPDGAARGLLVVERDSVLDHAAVGGRDEDRDESVANGGTGALEPDP